MSSLYSLLDHISGLPAKTVKTAAHRFHLDSSRLGEGNISTKPTKFLISNPSLLSSRGSNPYLGLAVAVNNGQSPLGVEFKNIDVSNQFGAQWVNNFNEIVSQNHLGFNPNQVCECGQKKSKSNFKNDLLDALGNQQAIYGKEKKQDKRRTRPNKVAAGAKGFIHILSIAGDAK